MPRPPKKTEGAPWVYASPKRLSGDQKERLFDLLGIDTDSKNGKKKAKQIAINIENWVGAYFSFCESSPPSAASIRDEITNLRKAANALNQQIITSSYWVKNEIEKAGTDLNSLARSLGCFVLSAGKAIETLQVQESRGQPKNQPLMMLINTLYGQFEKSYSTEEGNAEDDPLGRKKAASKRQALESFLCGCLDFAEIPHPKNILSLIYDPDIPESERLYIRQSL